MATPDAVKWYSSDLSCEFPQGGDHENQIDDSMLEVSDFTIVGPADAIDKTTWNIWRIRSAATNFARAPAGTKTAIRIHIEPAAAVVANTRA